MRISKCVAPEIIFGNNTIQQAGDACVRLEAIEVHSRVYEGSTFTLRLPLQFVNHTEV